MPRSCNLPAHHMSMAAFGLREFAGRMLGRCAGMRSA